MRTRRDLSVDIACFLFAVVFSVVTADAAYRGDVSAGVPVAEQVAGAAGCAAVFLRRRWPVPLAVLLMFAGTQFHFLTGAILVALFTVAVHRPRRVTAWLGGLTLAQFAVFLLRDLDRGEEVVGSALTYFTLVACALGWGLYIRSRRALIASLAEGAVRAADDARREVREEMAREMHDVLAHRLSLLSVQAGALEYNPGASPEDLRRAAGVIRDSAHQALEDLREVIGVLRGSGGARAEDAPGPRPGLAEVDRLLDESRAAGMRVTYRLDAAAVETLPATVGRTASRVVQEAVTNARKHAGGAEVTVTVTGRPGAGLVVEVGNPVRTRSPAAVGARVAAPVPGAGQGLIGMAERVALAGGRLEHGVRDGRFTVRADLPWPRADGRAGAEGAAA
ncbi:histidine kinase [Streptomyces sp. NPDC005012]|uniref:sensor histidine kinase n=1 Tax=Streptomyces sp. NPDC005012 TaxID=3154558 RepID=UPI0033B943CF